MKPKLNDSIRFALRIATQRAHACPYLCLLALALAGAVPSFAATLTVTNTNDSGAGSLRNAIAAATSGDTINFNLSYPATITLASTLSICNVQNLTISGPGASSQLAISGNGAVQVFNICSSASVTISGLTIEKGYVGETSTGGGIFNSGSLTITDSTLSGNAAGYEGGGIDNAGTLVLTNSTLSGNSVYGTGTSGNSGGGIYNEYKSTATVTNCTLTGNSAISGGAGIFNFGALTVTNSTLSGNSSTNSGPGAGNGILNPVGSVTLKSTLLAGNLGVSEGITTAENCAGSITSDGYNLSDDTTCASDFTQPTDKNDTPAGLDSKGLQNNGGPTQTIALEPGSLAVDAIPVGNCTDTNGDPVTTDQRGIPRPQGKGCDIGAYELVQAVPFAGFHPSLAIDDGRHPGFVLTSTFTLGSPSTGLNPATQAMTLTIASYTLTLPAGSFHKLWNASDAPYGYDGKVNGATVGLALVPLGDNIFSFDAAASPVSFPGIKNPVTVTLTFGTDTGTTSVQALITKF